MYSPPSNMVLKAEGTALALQSIFGEKAFIQYSQKGADLFYTPDQVKKIKSRLSVLIDKKPDPTGNINIHATPILAPIILKKAAPYLVALFLIGLIAGKGLR